MSRNVIRGSLFAAALLAVFCVITLVIPFPRNNIFWIAFGFGVLAILLQFYFFWSAFGKKEVRSKFYGMPVVRVGLIYLAVQVAVSLLEIVLQKIPPTWLVVLVNVLIFLAALLGCITTETMRDEVSRQDEKQKESTSGILELRALSVGLVDQCGDEELKKSLKKLADEFRYSDPVSSEATAAMEKELRQGVKNLQDAVAQGDNDYAKDECGRLLNRLRERNRICAVNK